jgi:hypothetical protein
MSSAPWRVASSRISCFGDAHALSCSSC